MLAEYVLVKRWRELRSRVTVRCQVRVLVKGQGEGQVRVMDKSQVFAAESKGIRIILKG